MLQLKCRADLGKSFLLQMKCDTGHEADRYLVGMSRVHFLQNGGRFFCYQLHCPLLLVKMNVEHLRGTGVVNNRARMTTMQCDDVRHCFDCVLLSIYA